MPAVRSVSEPTSSTRSAKTCRYLVAVLSARFTAARVQVSDSLSSQKISTLIYVSIGSTAIETACTGKQESS